MPRLDRAERRVAERARRVRALNAARAPADRHEPSWKTPTDQEVPYCAVIAPPIPSPGRGRG